MVTPKAEASQLSLELLAMIHARLAANLDAQLSSNASSSSQNTSPVGIRMFRGYVRFPGGAQYSDPRHLVGDTTSEESSDEEVLLKPIQKQKDASKPKKEDPSSKTKNDVTNVTEVRKRKRSISENSRVDVSNEAPKGRHKRTSSWDLLGSNFDITAPGEDVLKQVTKKKIAVPDSSPSKTKQQSLKFRSSTKYPDKNAMLMSDSDDEDVIPQEKNSASNEPPVKDQQSKTDESKSLKQEQTKNSNVQNLVVFGLEPEPTSSTSGKCNGSTDLESKSSRKWQSRSLSRDSLTEDCEPVRPKTKSNASGEHPPTSKASNNDKTNVKAASSASLVRTHSNNEGKEPKITSSSTERRRNSNSMISAQSVKSSRIRTSNSMSEFYTKKRTSSKQRNSSRDNLKSSNGKEAETATSTIIQSSFTNSDMHTYF